ncbi:hypothetical protein GCM10008967_33940 [Bacillus carboniphilus]|uniref:Sporulation protein YjcZ n=1 Tax=Bacillus carboniphilus TaxID=86663 RepID=A0ABN0WL02_9BACI
MPYAFPYGYPPAPYPVYTYNAGGAYFALVIVLLVLLLIFGGWWCYR